MNIEVKVPDLPESVADGVLMKWHKAQGEPVKRDENLVDIETDKVVLEIPSPVSGVLEQILKDDGAVVASGEVIARIKKGGAKKIPAKVVARELETVKQAKKPVASTSPAVRKLMEENRLDPAKITGTGKGGRIRKEDVLEFLEKNKPPVESTPVAPAPEKTKPVKKPVVPKISMDGRAEERVPMTRLRAKIAERLVQSQHTAAILTTFNEVNMKPVMDLRVKYKERFEKTHNVKLGFMSFFVTACVEALREFPVINASVDGNDIIYHGYYDIGIAVSSPRGLVVPILRDVDTMSFADIEKRIRELGDLAREGKLEIEDLTGGTFSITNGGVFGSMLSTPIINPPQSAILGMHNIVERPVVENGKIVIRPVMYVALSYDHRIVDGREAVQFLVNIKQSLEDPASMLLEL